MSSKVNFYTKKQIAQLKKLKGMDAVKKFAEENNRTISGVFASRSYYLRQVGKSRSSAGKRAAATRKKNQVNNSGVVKSSKRGEFIIPVNGLEMRVSKNGFNLVLKY